LAYEIDFYFNELFNDHLINIQEYIDKNKEKEEENTENTQDFKENEKNNGFYSIY